MGPTLALKQGARAPEQGPGSEGRHPSRVASRKLLQNRKAVQKQVPGGWPLSPPLPLLSRLPLSSLTTLSPLSPPLLSPLSPLSPLPSLHARRHAEGPICGSGAGP